MASLFATAFSIITSLVPIVQSTIEKIFSIAGVAPPRLVATFSNDYRGAHQIGRSYTVAGKRVDFYGGVWAPKHGDMSPKERRTIFNKPNVAQVVDGTLSINARRAFRDYLEPSWSFYFTGFANVRVVKDDGLMMCAAEYTGMGLALS